MRQPTQKEIEVAKALADVPAEPAATYWDRATRAAIRAMREPTEEVIDGGVRFWPSVVVGGNAAMREQVAAVYGAMIDAASPQDDEK